MAQTPAGTPSWVDLGSPDVDASVRFYGDLLGWEADEAGPVEETGGYRMFRSGGKLVAGVGGLQSEEQPPVWTTYIATDDADETVRRAEAAGGTIVMPPMQIMDAGRMAIVQDPTGAVFGLWQPGRHTGAELFNEPVSLTWNELRTRDGDAAERFYGEVFGWEPRSHDMGSMAYTTFFNGVRGISGGMTMGENFPAELPAHWGIYFTVADADAVAARAPELGGTVHQPPVDIPPGRFALLEDPHGAFFAVIQPTEEAQRAARTPEGVPRR